MGKQNILMDIEPRHIDLLLLSFGDFELRFSCNLSLHFCRCQFVHLFSGVCCNLSIYHVMLDGWNYWTSALAELSFKIWPSVLMCISVRIYGIACASFDKREHAIMISYRKSFWRLSRKEFNFRREVVQIFAFFMKEKLVVNWVEIRSNQKDGFFCDILN